MIHKLRFPLLFMLFLSALIGLKLIFSESDSSPGGSGKNPQGAAQVDGIIATFQNLSNEVTLTGSLIPNERTDLFPEIQGRIISIPAREGSQVNSGDILAKIQDTDLQAQFRKIKAQLELAHIQENRLKKLLAVQGVSKEEYETTLYQLQALQADSDLIQSQLAKTILRAPYAGTIGLRYVSEGAMVSPSVRILSMQKTNPIKIDFTVPEKYTHLVQKGESIYFTTQQDSQKYLARIIATEGMMDENTRSLKVRALSEGLTDKLVPGAFVKVLLASGKSVQSIVVPAISIVPVLKGQKVLVCRNSSVEEVSVITGTRFEDSIEILSGLEPGDTVLTSGIMSLKPGSAVEVNIAGKELIRP